MQPSHRSKLRPFYVLDFLKEANALEREGREILHLEAGQPGASAPPRVTAAAAACLEEGRALYTDAAGLPALRARIATHYGDRYDLDVDPARVAVTLGSSAAFICVFLAAFDPGARLGLSEPCYPAYPNLATAFGLEAVRIEARAEAGFHPTVADLAAAGPLDGVLIASPANPTGAVMPEERLAEICAYTREHGQALIADEIYHGVNFEGADVCALQHRSDAFIVNSFSKYFAMPGWRIGWAVTPDAFVRPMEAALQNLFISPHAMSQRAALAAFDELDYFDALVARYRANRDVLREAVARAGLQPAAPADGAFYLYVDISPTERDSLEFCRAMLHEIGVAATPGWDFDRARGGRYVRFSYAGPEEEIREAGARIVRWLT